MKQYTREQLGVNPFNPWNTIAPADQSQYENEVRYKMTVIVGLLKLSSRASTMMLHIVDNMLDTDYIYIDKKQCMEEEEIKSRTTIKLALDELITEGYIIPTAYRGWYWINITKVIKS